jgi:hypothetical protein
MSIVKGFGLYIDKEQLNARKMTEFNKMVRQYTDLNYRINHKTHPANITGNIETLNPLNKTLGVGVPTITEKNIGIIVVFKDSTTHDLENIYDNTTNALQSVATGVRMHNLFTQEILGWCYVITDIIRGIICIYDFFINFEIDSTIFGDLGEDPEEKFRGINALELSSLTRVQSIDFSELSTSIVIQFTPEASFKIGKIILDAILFTTMIFNYNATIWVGIDIVDERYNLLTDIFVDQGFGNPYLATTDPLNCTDHYIFVGLTKKNVLSFSSPEDIRNQKMKILYLFNQNIKKCEKKPICICSLDFVFNRKDLMVLRRATESLSTYNATQGDLSQKEFSGRFNIEKLLYCKDQLKRITLKNGTTIEAYITNIDDPFPGIYLNGDPIEFHFMHDIFTIEDIGNGQINSNCLGEYEDINFIWEIELDKSLITVSGEKYRPNDPGMGILINNFQTSNTTTLNSLNELFHNIVALNATGGIIEMNNVQQSFIKLRTNIDTVNNIYDAISKKINVSGYEHIIEGSERGANISKGIISFHTHPRSCYQNGICPIGFPSGPDLAFSLNQYIESKTIAQVVITLEGIYTLSLSKNFIENCLSAFKTIYHSHVTDIHGLLISMFEFSKLDTRFSGVDGPKKFCDFINNFSLNKSNDIVLHRDTLLPGSELYNRENERGRDMVNLTGILMLSSPFSLPTISFDTIPFFKCEFYTWNNLLDTSTESIFNISYHGDGQCYVDFDTDYIISNLYVYGNNNFFTFDKNITPPTPPTQITTAPTSTTTSIPIISSTISRNASSILSRNASRNASLNTSLNIPHSSSINISPAGSFPTSPIGSFAPTPESSPNPKRRRLG